MKAKYAISNGNQMIYTLPSGKAIKTRIDAEEALFWVNFDGSKWKIVDIIGYPTNVLKRYCTESAHWVTVKDDMELDKMLGGMLA